MSFEIFRNYVYHLDIRIQKNTVNDILNSLKFTDLIFDNKYQGLIIELF